MVIRRLSLEEWFLRKQLLGLRKRHFFLPGTLTVDLGRLASFYGGADRIPLTAIAVKAAAMIRATHPRSHRMVFSTLFGPRVLEFSESRVNVPVLVREGGRDHLSAAVVRDAEKKSVAGLLEELRSLQSRPLSSYPVASFVAGRANNAWNRGILRALEFFAYRSPKMYAKKGGGGISVSTVFSKSTFGADMAPTAFGPTALTIAACAVFTDGRRTLVRFGVAYDHTALLAADAVAAIRAFQILLESPPAALLDESLGNPGLGATL